jgi:hypothetical protein
MRCIYLTVVAPLATISAKALLMSVVLYPVRGSQYALELRKNNQSER